MVTVDYLFKWVEVIASPTNDFQVVVWLLKKVIFRCFGVPWVLIGDNDTHFIEKEFVVL